MRALIVLAALPLFACSVPSDNDTKGIQGTGSGGSRNYPVSGFARVELRGADDADVRVGGGFAVRAEGDPEVLDHLKIERDGDTLKIGRRNRSGFDWGKRHAKIFVTMPALAGVTTAGAGDLAIDRVSGGSFTGNLAGAGKIAIGTLAVDRADFTIAGAGGVTAAGTAKSVKVSIAGAGDIDATNLKADSADISITGSGDAKLAVNGAAKVSIMGAGDVDLGPAARCSVTKMGAGSVRCGQ